MLSVELFEVSVFTFGLHDNRTKSHIPDGMRKHDAGLGAYPVQNQQ